MQSGPGRGIRRRANRAVFLSACLVSSFLFISAKAFSQSDEVALTSSDEAVLTDPESAIVVGTRAAVGTDTIAEKAGKGVVGGVLGNILGGGDRSRASDRPDTVRDPTRKLDYKEIEAMDGGLETGARAMWGEAGLLVSVRIDDAPGKGTFQTLFLQSCDGWRLYPSRLELYKLWPERSVSVGWSRTTTVDGEVVDRDTGGWSDAWGDGVGSDAAVSGPGIWQDLGFERAHHGARQIGAWFDIDPAEFSRLGEVGLFVHTTLPEREPVTTAPSAWLIAPGGDSDVEVAKAGWHPDGWWGHCGGPPAELVASAGTASFAPAREDDSREFWVPFELAGVEAKVMSEGQGGGAGGVWFSGDENDAQPDQTTGTTSGKEEEAEEEPACGSIKGTVSTDPAKFFNVIGDIVVYVTGACDFCPPEPERDDVVITESEDGIQPSFSVVSAGTTIEIVNGYEDEISFSTEFNPSPLDGSPGHIMEALRKGERSEITLKRSGDYLIQSAWHRRIDANIFVAPNDCYAIADENGGYSIAELPPGTYHLKVHTRSKRTNLPEADVTVKAGEVTVRDFVLDREIKDKAEQ